ncbi:MAG TPA: hypothetical protein VLA36_02230 [Longimicrobiales bacterium]|nr:hypothetical protein [Longimicrobiales bacterium]
MSVRGGLHWGALAAEFTVVVLGILGALWMDEWRDVRRDAALEQVYLGRLEEDLEATLDLLVPVIARNERARDGIRATLALLDGPDTPTVQDSLARVVGFVAILSGLKPVDATYVELVQSGSLRVIRPDLRSLLALLDAQVRDVERLFLYENDQYINTVEPVFVHGPVNYGRVAFVQSRMASGGPSSEFGRLWGDRSFWNVASLKLETVESLLEPRALPGLRDQLERTLAAVRAARKE